MVESRNPSADDAMKAVVAVVQAACEFEINDAFGVFKTLYKTSFEEQLKRPGSWQKESPRLYEVAHQHGIITAAIATLNNVKHVDDKMFERACRIVATECHNVVSPRGQWCGGGRSDEAAA